MQQEQTVSRQIKSPAEESIFRRDFCINSSCPAPTLYNGRSGCLQSEKYNLKEKTKMKPGKLIIVRGLPGTGKSTIASRLAVDLGFVHIETDKLFVADGKYIFDPTRIQKYHDNCIDTCRTLLKTGWNVIVSNTFTEAWEMEKYPFDLVLRTSGKCFGNLHDVPDKTVVSMRERFVDVSRELYVEEKYPLFMQEILRRLTYSQT